jgi:hypothetical protein
VGILLAVGYLAASAVTCIPPPGSDPYMFVGAAVRYSRGLGLTTPFYPGTLEPLGKARLVTYTPLFHWIAGALTPTPDLWGVILVVAGMRAAQVLVWAWLFAALVRRAAPCLRWRWVIPLLLVGMVSQNGTPTEGRPEALVGLLQAVCAALVVLLPSAWHPVTLGVVLGLIGAAHPVAAILSAGAVAVYAAFRARLAGGVGFLAVTGMVSLAVFTGLLVVSPNGLASTIRGTLALSKIGIIPAWGDWSFYVLAGRTPFSGVLLAVTALAAVHLLARNWGQVRSPVILLAGLATFVGGTWYFSLRAPARNYNVLVFTPFFLAILAAWAGAPRGSIRAVVVRRVIVVGMVGLMALGWARYVACIGYYLADGVGLHAARAVFQVAADRYPAGSIGIPVDGFVLSDDYTRLRIYDKPADAVRDRYPLIVVLSATNRADLNMMAAAGYRRVMALSAPVPPRGLPRWAAGYPVDVYGLVEDGR